MSEGAEVYHPGHAATVEKTTKPVEAVAPEILAKQDTQAEAVPEEKGEAPRESKPGICRRASPLNQLTLLLEEKQSVEVQPSDSLKEKEAASEITQPIVTTQEIEKQPLPQMNPPESVATPTKLPPSTKMTEAGVASTTQSPASSEETSPTTPKSPMLRERQRSLRSIPTPHGGGFSLFDSGRQCDCVIL